MNLRMPLSLVIGLSCIKARRRFSKPLPAAVAAMAFIVWLYWLPVIMKTLPIGVVYAV
ncbi:putative drug resistance protein [Actinobacillus succinogenes 130Z]|uniref:Putative drug resistance protein n=1 Tax=Actinobacillus succinogenes (strain ATCC 55618 / DSM 22257 / CCUG 43843 / 130Z) TaxID=339671 RepID=A6VLX3_ACTSZ|nr:putative drug resistance protein [Actinobacillus succinogenes 130Z]